MKTQALHSSEDRHAANLIAQSRAKAIIEMVRTGGFMTIDALAEHFGVTPQTIRRDVNQLSERGLLRRLHGGVGLPPLGENLAYPARQVLNLEAKQRIARCLARDIPNGASLFFGIGTTPEQCALALLDHANLKVMTNNLNVAMIFCRNAGCEVTIAGGRLRNLDRDVVASEAHGFFPRYSVDIGIFGVGAVADDGTLLDFTPDEVAMRSSLMRHCRQRLLVLDHSKFGREATVRGGDISEAHAVYTDHAVPEDIAVRLRAAGVRLVIPHDDTQALTF